MINKCYCPVCQKESFVNIISKPAKANNGDSYIEFEEKCAMCEVCGEEILLDELINENQIAYESAIRLTNNIISNEDIEAIIQKYRIKKRNLSLILGLGEITITRYLDGYIPSKKNSDLLKNVLKNPAIYLDYLNENRDKINKQAYVKSKNRVNEILNISDNDTLVEDVAEYIIANNDETTNLVLQKLLYYVELFYMVLNGKNLFKSQCGAWEHGPVYGRIYYEYKENKMNTIKKENDLETIDSNIIHLVDSIINNFGCYSGKVLSYFTHNEDPWLAARKANKKNINKEDMIKYALKIKSEYGINTISDISKYSKSMFKKYLSGNN